MDKKHTKLKKKSQTGKPANVKVKVTVPANIKFATKKALTKVLKEGMKQYKNTLKELAKS